jgi:hypothetical protein
LEDDVNTLDPRTVALKWTTVRTCRGLIMLELRKLKAEHALCYDDTKRRKRVARIETLRLALSDLDRYDRATDPLKGAHDENA